MSTTPALVPAITRKRVIVAAVIAAFVVTVVVVSQLWSWQVYGSPTSANWGVVVSTNSDECNSIGFEVKGTFGPFTDNC
jgi:hypothetical protein